jgi:hypothetical protein
MKKMKKALRKFAHTYVELMNIYGEALLKGNGYGMA